MSNCGHPWTFLLWFSEVDHVYVCGDDHGNIGLMVGCPVCREWTRGVGVTPEQAADIISGLATQLALLPAKLARKDGP